MTLPPLEQKRKLPDTPEILNPSEGPSHWCPALRKVFRQAVAEAAAYSGSLRSAHLLLALIESGELGVGIEKARFETPFTSAGILILFAQARMDCSERMASCGGQAKRTRGPTVPMPRVTKRFESSWTWWPSM